MLSCTCPEHPPSFCEAPFPQRGRLYQYNQVPPAEKEDKREGQSTPVSVSLQLLCPRLE
jgi:hypothetical protein